VPEPLRTILAWADGVELEPNAVPAADDIGIDRVFGVSELSRMGDAYVFGEHSATGAKYLLRPDGQVDVVWGPDDVDRGDERGRTVAARDLQSLLADALVLIPEPEFDGSPTADELLSGTRSREPIDAQPRLHGSHGPPVDALAGAPRQYYDSLPDWLRALLRRQNGGRVRGVPVGAEEGDEVMELYCVAGRPNHPVTEASSLYQGLRTQGLPDSLFPGDTTLDRNRVAEFLVDWAEARNLQRGEQDQRTWAAARPMAVEVRPRLPRRCARGV
jgi:hypothetical protein